MVSQNSCIFPGQIWEIDNIQMAETVPCSLFPLLTDSFSSKTYINIILVVLL